MINTVLLVCMVKKRINNEYVNYVLDLMQPFGAISVRQMFGGYGLYNDGLFFAIIVDDELYFKADYIGAKYFAESGSVQFSYLNKNKIVKLSYWKVLPEVLEDSDLLKK